MKNVVKLIQSAVNHKTKKHRLSFVITNEQWTLLQQIRKFLTKHSAKDSFNDICAKLLGLGIHEVAMKVHELQLRENTADTVQSEDQLMPPEPIHIPLYQAPDYEALQKANNNALTEQVTKATAAAAGIKVAGAFGVKSENNNK